MKKVTAVAFLIAGGLALAGWSVASDAQMKKVTVQMDWIISGHHTGFFVAKEKGLYAANPDQALDIVVKANPEVDRAAAHLALLFGIDGLLTKAARDHGLGYMEPDRMAFQIDLMAKSGNFPPPKAEEVYTNRFVEKKPFTVSPALEAELAKIR